MRTIQELQDEYAKYLGFTDWKFLINNANIVSRDVRVIAKRYAEEVLKEATERARTKLVRASIGSVSVVDKDSILNIIKELK